MPAIPHGRFEEVYRGVPVSAETIAANVARVRQRIEAAAGRAGRRADDITLIAVTKYVGEGEVAALFDSGITHFGENRLDPAFAKMAALPEGRARWHMIAPLQRRKVRDALPRFDRFDAVDRMRLAEELQKRADEQDRMVRILLEVNVSGEAAKHGFAPEEVAGALAGLAPLDRLRAEGLMTMAPYDAGEAELRRVFSGLRTLCDRNGLPVISMGMSNDFEIAIEEGATEVRIGSALFA
jgi:hypothetical protein